MTKLITQGELTGSKGAAPETGLSWNTIHALLKRPEWADYRLPTVEEVLAIPLREWPEWTAGKTYFGQHWANSSLPVYVARVVYPDGQVETRLTSESNGGIAFRMVKKGGGR